MTDTATGESIQPVSVLFVCTGNICRSPMAEIMARGEAGDTPVAVRFGSAGISDEEEGNPIDPRAARQLIADGYAVGNHAAHKITREEALATDLVIGLENVHVRAVKRLAPAANVHLLSEFDPTAAEGQGVPDPWYGGPEGFARTSDAIRAAIPGVLAAVEHIPATVVR